MAGVTDPDLAEIARRATIGARRTHPDAEIAGVRRLPGGVSSLTYAAVLSADGAERPIVVKVAPPGLAPVRNRDVLRQASALKRLALLDGFPVPAVEFEDAGDPPDTPPLFAMELVAGESYEAALDVSDAPPSPEVAAERMRVAARALATLQSRSPADLGFGDEAAMPVAQELDRWERLFATVDADIAPGHEKLYARLAEAVPAGIDPRVLHGDYRVANMQFDGTTLGAVIDWEIWSVGDPRSDLAWLLMHTAPPQVFHEERSAADRAAGSNLPTSDELLATYLDERRRLGATDGELTAVAADLPWFLAVCYYKTASTIAVIHKRDRKRDRPDPGITTGARHLPEVLEGGHRLLDAASS